MPSSRFDPRRNSLQNAMVDTSVAPTATIFVPALLFDISGEFLAIRFFGPTPWSKKNVGHESCVMMQHGSFCIIDDDYHESFMITHDNIAKVDKKIDQKSMIFDGLVKRRRRGSIRAEIPCRMQWSAKSGLSRRLFSCPIRRSTFRSNFLR